ncbi:MAG: EVE domain-containing protein, partial [Chthoniobacteraceae bacterium]
MARETKSRSLEPVINAAQQWIRDCLIGDNSVFSTGPLWTPENVAEVRRAFVDHPDEGDDNFSTKLKGQMESASPSAKRLMAEMLWALLLFPSNIKVSTKRQQVGDMWEMSGERLREDLSPLSDEALAGIGSGGPGFNTNRWRELVFLISLVGDLKRRDSGERQKLLSEYDAFMGWIDQVPQEGHRQFRHMLRFFSFPDRVERMSSNRERWAVIAGFGVATEKEAKKWSDRQLDDSLLALRNRLQEANESEVLDFYEEPLRDRWRMAEKEPGDDKPGPSPETPDRNPGITFSTEDCAVFARYPNSVSWKDVLQADQGLFKSVWAKLKELSQHLVVSPFAAIPLKADTSHYVPNGRSPKEIWCCVYPAVISNKSYGLQIAVIISARGAELCFCMGSGTSQVAVLAKKHELETGLEAARKRLGSVSQAQIAAVTESQNRKWFYRKSWLAKPNETDFGTLAEWMSYASTPEGSGASISHYLSPTELQDLGTGIFTASADALKTFGPILGAVYPDSSGSRHWIFQGNPDQFDVDRYLRDRQEILWSVRQHKDRILAGDRVLIWKSGASGGVIAECSVIAPPSTEILEDAPELWKEKPDNEVGEMRCKLRVESSFVDAPIARAAIRTILPELSIVKAPQGTNFEITQADYEKIMDLKDSVTASIPFDSSALSVALEAIEATQMRVEPEFLNRFVTSLVAKPFLILTGNSGTGKTKLAEIFVQWLCRNVSSRFAIVPIGADWTDNRNVLGFVNHLRSASVKETGAEIDLPVYQTTKILDLLLDAARKENEAKPFFLILDEMNLSHVERYFADFLSAMESKEGRLLLHREGRPLPRKQGGPCDVPETLVLPRNVFVIGTVNVDETTYMFSPKVLDRANVIEFRVGTDAPVGFLKSGGRSIGEIAHAAAGYAEGFLEVSFRARNIKGTALALVANPDLSPDDAKDEIEKCRTTIADLFSLMQRRHQEFAFRSMAEILRFLAVTYELKPATEAWNWGAAMDAQILQKVLPKLHGSKRKVGSLLAALAKYCERPCDKSRSRRLLGSLWRSLISLAGKYRAKCGPARSGRPFELD